MQSNKRGDNGWVLCPSKSLPGKYYYFNVVNGEAVWSLPDAKKPLQQDIQNVADNTHSFPEPKPMETKEKYPETNPESSIQITAINKQANKPTFGQISFPKYEFNGNPSTSQNVFSTSLCMPNNMQMFGQSTKVVWAPIPLMVLEPNAAQTLDQVTQTYELDKVFVHTCNIPLCKRFINYENPVICFTKDNKLQNVFTSTPLKPKPIFDPISNQNESRINLKPVFDPISNPNESRINLKPVFDPISNQNESRINLKPVFVPISNPNESRINLKPVFDPISNQNESRINLKPIFDPISNQNESRINLKPVFDPISNPNESRINLKPIFDPISNPNDSRIKPKPLIKDPILDLKNLKISNEPQTFKSRLNLVSQNKNEKHVNIFQNEKTFANLTLGGKGKNELDRKDTVKETDVSQLDRNDLRLMLIARKRRHTEGESTTGPTEMKKIKTKYRDDHADVQAQKKRVTFASNCPEINNENNEFPNDTITIQSLRNMAQINTRQDCWYIVTDTDVLLENYEFINNFVLSDESCRVLIPWSVHRDISSLCSGDSAGRRHVYCARQIARDINNHARHLVIDAHKGSSMDFYNDTNMAINDDIFNCCLQKIQQKYHVVLLSNDEEILNRASLLHIHAYKFETIKDATNKSISETKTSQNVFLSSKFQSSRTYKMFENIPGLLGNTQTNRKSIFDDESITTEMTSEINRVIQGLNTKNDVPSPINVSGMQNLNSTANKLSQNINQIESKKMGRNVKIDQEPGTQKLNENNNAQNFNVANSETIKNMTEMSVENNLRRFHVRDKFMEAKIKERVEEWMCIFTQIMEDALCYVLQNQSFKTDLMTPWTLQEMVERIRLLYEDHATLKIIVKKLLCAMSECVTEKGKVKVDIKPHHFITTLGCGVLLIQCLKSLQPDREELVNAKQSLMNLMRTLEEPPGSEFDVSHKVSHAVVDDEKRQNYVKQPSEIIRYLKRHYEDWRSYDEVADQDPKTSNKEDTKIFRISGKNLNMLKIDNNKTMTITKCPNRIESKSDNLDNKNFTKPAIPKIIGNVKKGSENNNAPNTNVKIDVNSNKSNVNKGTVNDLDVTLNKNTFGTTPGPKVTRRMSIIKEYEEKLNKSPLDMDLLDYSDIISDYANNNTELTRNVSNETQIIDNSINKTDLNKNTNDSGYNNSQKTDCGKKIPKTDCKITKLNDSALNKNDTAKTKIDNDSGLNKTDGIEKDYISISDYDVKLVKVNSRATRKVISVSWNKNDEKDHISISDYSTKPDSKKIVTSDSEVHKSVVEKDYISVSDDTTHDSGVESECQLTYSLVKTFLSELSITFKAVHTFIDKNLSEFREEQLGNERKSHLHDKVTEVRRHMGDIINKLKRIVERESNETFLNNLLVKIDEAANDKRITRYRSVIRKCLEQAQNLQNALKIMLSVTGTEWDGSLSIHAESISSSIRYLNIFE